MVYHRRTKIKQFPKSKPDPDTIVELTDFIIDFFYNPSKEKRKAYEEEHQVSGLPHNIDNIFLLIRITDVLAEHNLMCGGDLLTYVLKNDARKKIAFRVANSIDKPHCSISLHNFQLALSLIINEPFSIHEVLRKRISYVFSYYYSIYLNYIDVEYEHIRPVDSVYYYLQPFVKDIITNREIVNLLCNKSLKTIFILYIWGKEYFDDALYTQFLNKLSKSKKDWANDIITYLWHDGLPGQWGDRLASIYTIHILS